MHEKEIKIPTPSQPPPIIPKPIFKRLLMLFGGGAGCLFVGIVVAMTLGDMVTLALSFILGTSLIAKGSVLRGKVRKGLIYEVSGVCVGLVSKFFGRYRRIELINVDTGGSVHFILPKKVIFKIGHVYTCFFDNPVGNRPLPAESEGASKGASEGEPTSNMPKSRFFNDGMDLPTNGFLGFEDFGVYQEKPAAARATIVEAVTADGVTAEKTTLEKVASEGETSKVGVGVESTNKNEEVVSDE